MATVDVPSVYDKLEKMLGRTPLKRIITGRMVDILPSMLGVLYRIVKRHEIAQVPHDESHIDFFHLTANDGAFVPASIDPVQDIAVLQYTGGTTGIPKGAMLTHANLIANVEQSRLSFPRIRGGENACLAFCHFSMFLP